MAKVKVTYTRDQLRAFTIAELKTLDLYKRAKISKDVTKKADIIREMLAKQKAEKKPKKVSKPESKASAKPKVDIVKENKVEEVVFHRVKRKKNRHLH